MRIGKYEIGWGHQEYPNLWGLIIVKYEGDKPTKFMFIPTAPLISLVIFAIAIWLSKVIS